VETQIHEVAITKDAAETAKDVPPVVWFLAAALALRVLGLNSAALWFDEAVSKFRASLPLALYFTDYTDYIGPNIWDFVLRPFAYGPVWLLRVPALIVAMVALWLGWELSKLLLFTRPERITAAILMAILPGLIWQAQDARYYAALGLLYVAAIYFAVRKHPTWLLACMALLPYIHPVGAFYALAALVVAWISGLRANQLLLIGAVAAVTYVPRIYGLLVPAVGRPAIWTAEMTPLFLLDQTAKALSVGTLGPAAGLTLLLIFAVSVAAALSRARERSTQVVLAAGLLPIFIMLAVSVIMPVYLYRPVQPVLIPLCLSAALALAPGRGLMSKILQAAMSVLLIAALSNWNPAARGGYLDNGAATITRNWQEGDRIVYASPTVALPFAYYLPDKPGCLIPRNGMGELPRGFQGITSCTPHYADPGMWLVWHRDPGMNSGLTENLRRTVAGRLPVWRSDFAWQFRPVELYYIP
jgi:hypothetical protein